MPELNRLHVHDRIRAVVVQHRTELIGCPSITTVDQILDSMIRELISHVDEVVEAAIDHALSDDGDGS